MAKKYSLGKVLFFSAASAALGGIAAYKHRKDIEKTVQEISDRLENLEEEGFFDVDLTAPGEEDEPNYIQVNVNRDPAPEETPAADDEAQESDFADHQEAQAEEPDEAPKEPSTPEG